MTNEWVRADSWCRRDVDADSYLTVSRDRSSSWTWQWTARKTGALIYSGAGLVTRLAEVAS